MKQFISFVKKEFLHIFRDKRTMLILLIMPIVLTILFGFAVTTEVKNSRVAILDMSKDQATRKICERLGANHYFTLTHDISDINTAYHLFQEGKIDMTIAFSENFAAETKRGGKATIQIIADGSEPNQAAIRTGYAQQVLASCQQELANSGIRPQWQIVPDMRMLYNPQSKSEYNFVPAVIGMILMLICAMMTSIAIVKEKEMGTMEILLASPLPPITIVLAKLVPYFVISCVNLATILTIAALLLHIPVAGSIIGFIAVTLLYILVALLLGLLISTLVSSQLAAMLLSLLLIVPTLYLSGMAFPLESMPQILQNISVIIPARWYIEMARKLMIQGVEMHHVVHETVILASMAAVLLIVSWRKFKTRLE